MRRLVLNQTLPQQQSRNHNRNDPEASRRFVKLSEAYAVLGNPTKRERYDRDTQRPTGGPPSNVNRGSHSSYGPYGSRPANGLSRRRTQFRGPPPSFYRSGGWGSQGGKRGSQAEAAASSPPRPAPRYAGSGASNIGGIGTGSSQTDWNNDVPYFDRDGHYRTQEQQEQRRMKRIRKDSVDYDSGGSMLINFLLVSGVISLAYLISTTFENGRVRTKTKAHHSN
ncbi:hypothetical protein MMC22_000776 [Lobaria immixta]|nr:hypothetical protein [Lobaria immixta]